VAGRSPLERNLEHWRQRPRNPHNHHVSVAQVLRETLKATVIPSYRHALRRSPLQRNLEDRCQLPHNHHVSAAQVLIETLNSPLVAGHTVARSTAGAQATDPNVEPTRCGGSADVNPPVVHLWRVAGLWSVCGRSAACHGPPWRITTQESASRRAFGTTRISTSLFVSRVSGDRAGQCSPWNTICKSPRPVA
jgi:hypothetical protein